MRQNCLDLEIINAGSVEQKALIPGVDLPFDATHLLPLRNDNFLFVWCSYDN